MGQEDELMLSHRLRRSGPESIIFIPGLGATKSSFDTCFELASFRDYTHYYYLSFSLFSYQKWLKLDFRGFL